MNNKVFVELTVDVSHEPSVVDESLKNERCSGQNFDLQQASCSRRKSSSFCGEVDFRDIELQHAIGSGSYGAVYKAKWNSRTVAVKIIDSEKNKLQTFLSELRHLSTVSHSNIIKLYGASTKSPAFLVMEYAADGSLYDLLHELKPAPPYKASHAVSWALQCAQGVNYLHNMNPKLVHRDLKPGNLLLTDSARHLKICDFGTVCDLQSYMTNNQGSAAYMAPEVFEGSSYTEKCDVFSFGILLWETLTRSKPFEDLKIPYRIMWAVKEGRRPPPIDNCPKSLQILMENCWHHSPDQRPSMDCIVKRMNCILQLYPGSHEPILIQKLQNEDYLRYSSLPTHYAPGEDDVVRPSGVPLHSAPNSTNNSTDEERSQSTSGVSMVTNDFENKLTFLSPAGKLQFESNSELYTLPTDYEPVKPLKDCEESVKIYEEHVNMLKDYMELQQEANRLLEKKNELIQELEDREKIVSTRVKLEQEKEQLTSFRDLLKSQMKDSPKQ